MKIDLLGGSYGDKYAQINSQRTVNWYTAYSQSDQANDKETASDTGRMNREAGKEMRTLKPFPVLTLLASNTGNRGRGAISIRDKGFVVIDNTFYQIYIDGTLTQRGTLSASPNGATNKVWMEANNENQIMLADQDYGYIYNHSTAVFTQITDVDFPGADTLTSQDGRFIVTKNGRVYFSNLLDGLSWDGVNVYTPSYKADKVKAVISLQEEIFNFGEETMEAYFDDETTPFRRMARSSVQYGIIAPESLNLIANTVFLVSRYTGGQPQVIQISPNHEINTISSENSIAWDFGKYQSLEDIYSWTFSAPDGHIFYVLTIPSAEQTLVYDVTTKDWCEWSSKIGSQVDGTPIYGRCLVNHHLFLKGKHIVTSFNNGNIYYLDWEGTTDNGDAVIRQRDTQIFHSEYKQICVHELEVDMNTGVGTLSGQGSNPVMMVQISRNGGKTFGPERFMRLSKHGDYDYRAKLRTLGMARNWVIRFKVSDPINIALIGAKARGSVGSY